MSKLHEINSLIEEYVAEETNVSLEEIEARSYEYYESGELEPTAYDYVMGKIEDLK